MVSLHSGFDWQDFCQRGRRHFVVTCRKHDDSETRPLHWTHPLVKGGALCSRCAASRDQIQIFEGLMGHYPGCVLIIFGKNMQTPHRQAPPHLETESRTFQDLLVTRYCTSNVSLCTNRKA